MDHATWVESLKVLDEKDNGDVTFLARFLPHLTRGQIEYTIANHDFVGQALIFALPPVHFVGALLGVLYKPNHYGFDGDLSDLGNLVDQLDLGPDLVELKRNVIYVGGTHVPYPRVFVEEAEAFARQNWPEALKEGTPLDVATFHLVDSTVLTQQGEPSTSSTIYLVLNRSLTELFEDITAPPVELLERATIEVAVGYREELSFDLYNYPHSLHDERGPIKSFGGRRCEFVCAADGSGLSYAHCEGCGNWFYERAWRAQPFTSLTPSAVNALLAAGHAFSADPTIAQERDRELWEKGQ